MMAFLRRYGFRILALVCCGIFLWCLGHVLLDFYWYTQTIGVAEDPAPIDLEAEIDCPNVVVVTEPPLPPETEAPEPEPTEPEPTEPPYDSPIDFATLQESNPDIYGWIRIPGCGIDCPLVQNGLDDTYYLSHDSFRTDAVVGALFTEHTYNSTDFTDPVTVVYGHRANRKGEFGVLQDFYSRSKNFWNSRDITVFLPDREIQFEIFAAMPYDNRHILASYDFSSPRVYQAYFADIFSRKSKKNLVDSDCVLTSDTRVLVLSTCLKGTTKKRFLVLARELDA